MKALLLVASTSLLFFSLLAFGHKGEVHEDTKPKVERSYESPQSQKSEPVRYPSLVKIHPPVVHFAIATPVVLLLVNGFYLLRKRDLDSLEYLLLLVASSSVVAAAITGYLAHEAMEEVPIKREALELLHTHESVGIYLALLFAVIFAIRSLLIFKPSAALRAVYLLLLTVGVLGILLQGNMGGSIVYDFGVGTNKL